MSNLWGTVKYVKMANTEKPWLSISRPCQRNILLFLIMIGVIQGLVMTGVGVFLSFRLGDALKIKAQSDEVGPLYMTYFAVDRVPSKLPLQLLTDNVGYTLFLLGGLVVVVNLAGLLGVGLLIRAWVLLFLIVMVVVVLTEIFCLLVVVHEGSPLNVQGRVVALEHLMERASVVGVEQRDDPWLASLYLLMIGLDCCGVDGPDDFHQLFLDKYVPAACCTRTFMLDVFSRRVGHHSQEKNVVDSEHVVRDEPGPDFNLEELQLTAADMNLAACTMMRADDNVPSNLKAHQKQKGCYQAIFETMRRNFYWLLPAFVFVITTQMGSVVTAIYVINKRLRYTEPPPQVKKDETSSDNQQ